MLDEKRIKEAKENIATYIEEELIWKVNIQNKDVLNTYIRNYKESLAVAESVNSQNISSLWVIVSSYYAMFYVTNAVLYCQGYKIGNKVCHKITSDALIVFIRDKLKKNLIEEYEEAKAEALEIIGSRSDEIIGYYDQELDKRSIFQYESTDEIKKSKAETSLKRAKNFVFELSRLIKQ